MTAHLPPPAKKEGINWNSVLAFSFFHAGAIAAFFYFSWQAFFVALLLYWITLSFGIGMGYHRLLTHRSYKVPKAVEYVLTICGAMALEGGPISWVATHRVHHQFSDKDGDPHTPRDGKWWAHLIWMLVGDTTICTPEEEMRYAPDLRKDAFHVWLNKYHVLPLGILSILLYVAGGLPFVLWGVFARVTMGLHATWMVNSLTHFQGRRRFATHDDSRNNLLVALLTFGEGWHNNQDAHPPSARHGLAWWELDMTWIAIRILRQIGVARAVQSAKLPLAESVTRV
jgi:fatty-acid desaturase